MPSKTFNNIIKDNNNTQAGLILGGVIPIIAWCITQEHALVAFTVPGLLAGGIVGNYARRIKEKLSRKKTTSLYKNP